MKTNTKSGRTVKFLASHLTILSLLLSIEAWSQEPAIADTAAARALFEQGSQLQKAARYDSAIVLFDKATEIYVRANRLGRRLLCLNAKAQCLQEKGNYGKAQDALQIGAEAEQMLLKEEPSVAAQRYVMIGSIYRRQGKYDSSLAAANASLRIGHNIAPSNRGLEWDICSLFAGTYFDLGEHDSALAYNRRALQLMDESRKEDQENISSTYNSIANMYETRGDYQKALDYFTRSLDVRRKVQGEKHPDIAALYNNIAAIHMRLGDYDLSVEYYLKSLSIMNEILEIDNPSFGIRYNNIAMAYRSRGEFDKALEAGNKSKAIFVKKFGAKHPNVGGVVNNIGRTYSDMKQYERALEMFQEALAIWEEKLGQKHPNVLQTYFNIGETYGKLGDFEKATPWLQKSLTLRRETLGEKNVKTAQSYNGLAVVSVGKKQLDSAALYYQKALIALVEGFDDADANTNRATLKSSSDLDLLTALVGKAEVLGRRFDHTHQLQDLTTSLDSYEHAAQLVESIRRGFGTEGSKIQLGRTAFDAYEGAVSVALRVAGLTKDPAYTSMAFSFAERSKAGVLLDAIAESKAETFAGIPDSLRDRESALRTDLAYSERQVQKEKDKGNKADKAKIAKYQNVVFDDRQKYKALVGSFEKQYPDYHALKFQTSTVSLEDVQQLLPDARTALLEYLVGDSSVTIFAVTKSRSFARSFQLHSSLNVLVKQYRQSVQNLNAEEYLGLALSLYRQLIEPVKSHLKGIRKLYIVPDGILNYLPFESLLTKRVLSSPAADFSALPYLIRDYEISYYLSARLLVESQHDAGHNAKPSFLGLAPVFADQPSHAGAVYAASPERVTRSRTVDGQRFPELKESENEVKGIVGLFEANKLQAKAYLNKSAQESVMKSSGIGGYRFIHVATHGLINEEKPELSGLIFAVPDNSAKNRMEGSSNDGVLYSGEIYSLRLNADLVVLSACESGLGQVVKGEGMLGLTRGFFYAGAQNLLVSLWQVADKSTADLMVQFYRNILKGQSYPAALRAAKLSMINAKQYAHPIEWSPFVLTGR